MMDMVKDSPFLSEGPARLVCVSCALSEPLESEANLCVCGGLFEIKHPAFARSLRDHFDSFSVALEGPNASGVWRFGDCVVPLPSKHIVTHPEGYTRLYRRNALSRYAGLKELWFKHEGENPTGSFKDRGMTVAVSAAMAKGKRFLACASTGNTSASLAAYASQTENAHALVFLPEGKVAAGKLAQALAYGATQVVVKGDFDRAMELVKRASAELGIYLVNSVNPFRLEGQKTIIWELLSQMSWSVPDWIVVPGGNLGNTSAFGKALREAFAAGWIDRCPRLAVIQASGAAPFAQSFERDFLNLVPVQAETIASAIRIGNPVNFPKAKREIRQVGGVVASVTDDDIRAAKYEIDRSGIGCEPASACSLAGVRQLVSRGLITADQTVVGILTGHVLKDTDVIMDMASRRSEPTVTLDGSLAPLEDWLRIRS